MRPSTETLGATLRGSSNLDLSFVSLSALTAKLDPSLDLFADVVLHPSYPETEVKREQKLVIAGIEREQNAPATLAKPVSQARFVRARFRRSPVSARASLRSPDTTDAKPRPQTDRATGRVLRSTPKGKRRIDQG